MIHHKNLRRHPDPHKNYADAECQPTSSSSQQSGKIYDDDRESQRRQRHPSSTSSPSPRGTNADASRFIRFHRRSKLFQMKPTLSECPMLDLLNCQDKELRDQLTERWRDHKLEELNFVGVVAALLTGCLTSTGSWPTILPTEITQPWPIRTCWFIGIVFGLASILSAGAQTIRLHRISAHRNACHRIRLLIKGPARRTSDGFVRPSRIRMYMWQLPVAFLSLSVVMMVAGIWVLVWTGVFDQEDGFDWSKDDNLKSATMFTAFAGVTVIAFGYAHRMLHREIHEEEDEDTDE